MSKVYRRTENGTEAIASQQDGRNEINNAMMSGQGDVREMSQISRTDFAIEYKDNRSVLLILIDAPEESGEEPMDWASTSTGKVEHRFGEDGRARCNRRYRAYDRPVSQGDQRTRRTRSEIESGPYADLYTFCPACSAL
jgi:hypothetical protein